MPVRALKSRAKWFGASDPASTKTARETIFRRYSGAANEETRPFDYPPRRTR